jgi:hypothetical protein
MPRRVENSTDRRLRRLTEATDESAAAELFVELCRASPALRRWLWTDFARDPEARAAVARHILGRNGVAHFAELTGDAAAWRRERQHLQTAIPRGIYGGLTWSELQKLILQFRSARTDLAAFLLAHDWQHTSRPSPRLLRAAFDFLSAVFAGEKRLLRHLVQAIELNEQKQNRAERRAAVGFADWWKLHALLFMLRHPQPAYRTRELAQHLRTLGLKVSAKELRRFCGRHGIRRDMRAGRPALTREDDHASATRRRATRSRRGRPYTASELHRP